MQVDFGRWVVAIDALEDLSLDSDGVVRARVGHDRIHRTFSTFDNAKCWYDALVKAHDAVRRLEKISVAVRNNGLLRQASRFKGGSGR